MSNNSKKVLEDIINEEEGGLSDYERENYILAPLLGEINSIEDPDIKSFVRAILLRAGAFWDAPSSLSVDYSPPDEHTQGGTILHTKRVVRIVKLICESYNYVGLDRDIALASAILHDLTRIIQEKDDDDPRVDIMYPYTIDRFVKFVRDDDMAHASENQSSTLTISEVAATMIMRLIHCHLGPWSPIPETYPETNLEMLLHIADQMAKHLHHLVDGDELKMDRWLL